MLSLLLYVLQRQRAYAAARRAGARLQAEVAERTRELRDANALLQTEVDERRRTEARLRATQNELLQAGKLAALGQMSAAIAHEVNQPLAAIRTFMASAKIYPAARRRQAGHQEPRPDRRPRRAHGEDHQSSENIRAQERARKARAGAGRARDRRRAVPHRKPDQGRGRAARRATVEPICWCQVTRCSSSRCWSI